MPVLAPIKTITKFSNVIELIEQCTRHACKVVKSCLESVIGQLKGQLTRHAYLSGQITSCAHAIASHFAELTNGFFHENV